MTLATTMIMINGGTDKEGMEIMRLIKKRYPLFEVLEMVTADILAENDIIHTHVSIPVEGDIVTIPEFARQEDFTVFVASRNLADVRNKVYRYGPEADMHELHSKVEMHEGANNGFVTTRIDISELEAGWKGGI